MSRPLAISSLRDFTRVLATRGCALYIRKTLMDKRVFIRQQQSRCDLIRCCSTATSPLYIFMLWLWLTRPNWRNCHKFANIACILVKSRNFNLSRCLLKHRRARTHNAGWLTVYTSIQAKGRWNRPRVLYPSDKHTQLKFNVLNELRADGYGDERIMQRGIYRQSFAKRSLIFL